jgi:hypothetical protein
LVLVRTAVSEECTASILMVKIIDELETKLVVSAAEACYVSSVITSQKKKTLFIVTAVETSNIT